LSGYGQRLRNAAWTYTNTWRMRDENASGETGPLWSLAGDHPAFAIFQNAGIHPT